MASPNGIAKLPRIKPGRRGTLIQLIDIQHALHRDALNGETTPSARAQVARAFSELEYLKRVIRMKPAPKPIDVSVAPRKSRSKSGPSWSAAAGNGASDPRTPSPAPDTPKNP